MAQAVERGFVAVVAALQREKIDVVDFHPAMVTLVDLRDVPAAAVGDVATLIGRDGDAEISLQDFAERCGTIPYEVLTGLGPRPERRYIDAAADPGRA